MVIKRYLNDENLSRMKKDFAIVIEKVYNNKNYFGELDLALRNDYFNIYYQGNSLAKVDFLQKDKYKITINSKFFKDTEAARDKRFEYTEKKDKCEIILNKNLLYPFFQVKYIDGFFSRIHKTNYSEELKIEQAIIADNLNREEIIFIDRQIRDSSDFKGRMDLLALKKVGENDNKYNFFVIEAKLGNNRELEKQVAGQLKKYIDQIRKYFPAYKSSYEKNFKQKRELDLIKNPNYEGIEIILPVEGMVLAVGYSEIAKIKIDILKRDNPDLKVGLINYELDLNKLY